MDKAGPERDLPEHDGDADRGGERRPEGICAPTYAEVALKLLDQGYEPLPILPGKKRPAVKAWMSVRIDEAQVEEWCREFGHCWVGLRTGQVVGVDIDILDPDAAYQASEIVKSRLGDTLIRVGKWPKQLLLYRTITPFAKTQIGKIEVLCDGQQFVAFGIHPVAGLPYDWPMGESPLDVSLDALPLVDEAMIEALLAELQPIAGAGPTGSRHKGAKGVAEGQTRDADGRVTDGRDGWLSIIVFHAMHDALDRGEDPDGATLGAIVWARFAETTDLSRPRQDGRQAYGLRDALRKVRDKLKLHRSGNLPGRHAVLSEPDYVPPKMGVAEARIALDRLLTGAINAVVQHHLVGACDAAPRMGIRATVGLGKSTMARHHLFEARKQLAAIGPVHRILNFVQSLALADETVDAWAALGIPAVALRCYEALHRVTREPMCRDIRAVRAAIDAGYDIQSSACYRSKTERCAHFDECAKQANRRAVKESPIVVAAYDAMFSGFAGDNQEFGLMLVDEACWQRSVEVVEGLTIETLPFLGLSGLSGSRKRDSRGAELADIVAARMKLSAALASMPKGEVIRQGLKRPGIDAEFCRASIEGEEDALVRVNLTPGQSFGERETAVECSARRSSGLRVIRLWTALAELLEDDVRAAGKVWLEDVSGKEMHRRIRLYQHKVVPADIARLPLLHLDATLRPDVAQTVLPELEVATVEAAAPHQHIRLISGSFGKSMVCPDQSASPSEQQRRANRLQECVDYVRWHAMRHKGSPILVITYKSIEAAFGEIAGVEVAHFNAVAGLDSWSDVGALFLIGRPLPQSDDLAELTGAYFDRSVEGKYAGRDVGILLESGRFSAIRAIHHTDPSAEILRAAICDDEVMQALGRGRGINRAADNPLEVHLMADVALPVAYDRVQAWETVCPDMVQRMLLAGLAVDSPADAAKRHPGLFGSVDGADHAFRRAGFNRHFPIENIYRETAVKSAAYRLGGRGRSWQRAVWLSASAFEARTQLEQAIGPLVEWTPK